MGIQALTALSAPGKKRKGRQRPEQRFFKTRPEHLEDRRLLAILWVDNNPANAIPHPLDFTTITAAVAAALPGDTIKVSPGVGPYDESVVVDKQLTLIGGQIRLAGEFGATIVEVPDSSAGFNLQANSITVKQFTVRPDAAALTDVQGVVTNSVWSGEQILNNIFAGNTMGVYLNSSGVKKTLVQGNTFASNNFPGASSGNGIYSDQGLKNAVINDNYFSGHTNASINLVGGDGSFASLSTHSKVQISNNKMNNDAPIVAVNMIDSSITGNKINFPAGSGIFFAGAVTRTEVSCNTLNGNATSFTGINLRIDDVSYNVAHDPSGAAIPNSGDKIKNNKVFGFGDSGIRLRDGSHNIYVEGNTANNNGTAGDPTTGDGISIEDSYANTVKNNTANNNARDGIRLFNAQGNTVYGNTANNNVEAGIYLLSGSAGNTLEKNTASHNGDFLLGTGDGIRVEDSSSNTVKNNTTKNNAHDGIHVLGTSAGNFFRKNTSKFNSWLDLEDETIGGGTAGTANTWSQNTANTRSPAGLL